MSSADRTPSAATKRKRAMRSPCCGARVVVPVDVTAHLLVNADGTLSERITDTVRGIRWSANHGDAAIEEAYCDECGSSVEARPLREDGWVNDGFGI